MRHLPAGSLRGRLAWGTLWSFSGAAVSQGSILAASVITARLLGTVGFGELGIINNTVGMFGVFAGFGLGITATKHVAEFRTSDPVRAGRIIALSSVTALAAGGVISLALVVLAPFLASHTLAAPHLIFELRAGALLLLLYALNGAQTGSLCGLEAFRATAAVSVVRGLFSFLLTVGGALVWRLPGAVCGLVLAAAITCLVNEWVLRRECLRATVPVCSKGLAREWRILLGFSLPAFLSSAMVAPAGWVAATMLVNRPGGYVEMGVFHAVNQWRTALLFLPGLIGQVAVPILASLQNAAGGHPARRVLAGSMLANGLCTLPIVLVLLPFGSWIMSFYGPAFAPRGAVLQIALLSSVLLAVQTPVGNLIAAFGRMWTGFLMNAGWAACFLSVTSGLLALGWGAQALACAYLVGYLVHALWTFWFAAMLLRPSGRSTAAISAGVAALDAQSV